MTPHDTERLAAALNVLRPDWPTRQLETLLADPRLNHRPLRDVTVALAWVACETRSASPYRVLEQGPWWRAVAVDKDDQATPNQVWVDDHLRCRTCTLPEPDCRRRQVGLPDTIAHPFEPAITPPPVDASRTVEALRQAKAQPVDRSKPPAPKSDYGTRHVDQLRRNLPKPSGPEAAPDTPGVAAPVGSERHHASGPESPKPDPDGVPSEHPVKPQPKEDTP